MRCRIPLLAPLLAACLGATQPTQAEEPGPAAPDGEQVCAQISAFPDTADPDRFLSRLGTSREGMISELDRLRRNLEQ
jgi:hypothetical protein